MGVLGVEGVMRSCCEQTLRLLEEQREIIITLLRVLLYDPLFSWSISPTKTDRLLGSSETESVNNGHGMVFFLKIDFELLKGVQNTIIYLQSNPKCGSLDIQYTLCNIFMMCVLELIVLASTK